MEELKGIVFLVADLLLIASGTVYGWKFLKKRNYLLGFEWWIVAFSATNMLLWALTADAGIEGLPQVLYGIAMYLDAFSRAFGFPLIAVVGLMAITHHYRPSKIMDVLWFAGGFAGAALLVVVAPEYRNVLGSFSDSSLVLTIEAAKPWFYLVMWSGFSCFVIYIVRRLFQVGERLLGWSSIVAVAASQTIASIYDFFEIPGDDADRTLFYIAALSTWAFSLMILYHAYSAIERAQQRQRQANRVSEGEYNVRVY